MMKPVYLVHLTDDLGNSLRSWVYPQDTVVVYVFDVIEYSITYHTDDVTVEYETYGEVIHSYNVESETFDLPNLVSQEAGHYFLGWYDNPEFNGAPITTITVGSTGNLDLYPLFS